MKPLSLPGKALPTEFVLEFSVDIAAGGCGKTLLLLLRCLRLLSGMFLFEFEDVPLSALAFAFLILELLAISAVLLLGPCRVGGLLE